jgi:hypothetical protein
MSLKYVYIAGPMSQGSLMDHVREAVKVGHIIAGYGGVPYLPQLSVLWHLVCPMEYEAWLRLDFAVIDRQDAVLRLEGPSSGADREIAYAQSLGKPTFFDLDTYLKALVAWQESTDPWQQSQARADTHSFRLPKE